MYKYNIYLGYQKEIGGFPLLGTIDYSYPLSKGDTVILSENMYDKVSNLQDVPSIVPFKYRQTYMVASVHHWIDNPDESADVYIVMDNDYKKHANRSD